MATAEVVSDLPTPKKTYNVAHPLCPLTASEISRTANLIKSVWPVNIDLRFKAITLLEPEKKSFIPYLEAEHNGGPLPKIPRKAFVAYYIRNTVSALDAFSLWRAYDVRIAFMRLSSTSPRMRWRAMSVSELTCMEMATMRRS
jgi:Cu2+-containing amine oxidase